MIIIMTLLLIAIALLFYSYYETLNRLKEEVLKKEMYKEKLIEMHNKFYNPEIIHTDEDVFLGGSNFSLKEEFKKLK